MDVNRPFQYPVLFVQMPDFTGKRGSPLRLDLLFYFGQNPWSFGHTLIT